MGYTGQQKRDYQRLWMAKRRQDWIDSKGGACFVCGSADSLEVDHIDRSLKSCEPAAIWSRRQEFRDKELANCQVLCADHHKEKTLREREKAQHGTHSMYSLGCRCEHCTKAHAALAKKTRGAGKKW